MIQTMLTTVDNPYNPFTHYDEWFAFDMRKGYNTPSVLARTVVTSDELSDADQQQAIDDGIRQILDENVTGMYRTVTMSVPDPDELGEFEA